MIMTPLARRSKITKRVRFASSALADSMSFSKAQLLTCYFFRKDFQFPTAVSSNRKKTLAKLWGKTLLSFWGSASGKEELCEQVHKCASWMCQIDLTSCNWLTPAYDWCKILEGVIMFNWPKTTLANVGSHVSTARVYLLFLSVWQRHVWACHWPILTKSYPATSVMRC
jgi:hypothetical protein